MSADSGCYQIVDYREVLGLGSGAGFWPGLTGVSQRLRLHHDDKLEGRNDFDQLTTEPKGGEGVVSGAGGDPLLESI